jgi:hypothetical protein
MVHTYRIWKTSNLTLDLEIHQHLGSLKHVINIIMCIRDTVCYILHQSYLAFSCHKFLPQTMAAASSTVTAINLMSAYEKLVQSDHVMWKAHVITVLHGAQLARFLEEARLAPTEKVKAKGQKGRRKNLKMCQTQLLRYGGCKNTRFSATC